MLKTKFQSLLGRIRHYERGQVFILFIIFSGLIFVSAVGAIDLGTFIRARQKLEIAVDASALAGGLELPESGTAARVKVLQYIDINYPGVNHADIETTFRCVVGDRDEDGNPDAVDIPLTCDPGAGAVWSCADALCISWCEFVGDNKCNVLGVQASRDVPLVFTTLLGLPPLEVTASRVGACNGPCGAPPTQPLDVAIIIDRSSSMSAQDMTDAKAAALAALNIFNPDLQHVALAVLGAGNPGSLCNELAPGSGGNWLIVPLTDDYKNLDGTLNTSSTLVSTINCLTTSSQGTDLGSPLNDTVYGRPDVLDQLLSSTREVPLGIIFLTDGAVNAPTTLVPDNPCQYANNNATILKNQDIEIITIGYGIASENCQDANGPYVTNTPVTELLADMATDSLDDHGHCSNQANIDAENGDGDHFMCQAKGSDLEKIITAAAAYLAGGLRLIGFPP